MKTLPRQYIYERVWVSLFPTLASRARLTKTKRSQFVLSFRQYKLLLEDVYCFLRAFKSRFNSNLIANLVEQIPFFLRVSEGDMDLLIKNKEHFQNCVSKIHPCLNLFGLKYLGAQKRVYKFMRQSLKYSFNNKGLYRDNNILHFLLFWNQLFAVDSLSENSAPPSDLDIFLCKPFYKS